MRAGFESRLRPPRRMPFLEPETALPVVIVASLKGRHPPRQNTRAGCGQERFDAFSTTCTKTQRLTDDNFGTATKPTRRRRCLQRLRRRHWRCRQDAARLRLYEACRLHHCPLVTKGGYAVYPFPAIMNQ